jgi:lactoylglutathione lyase
MLKKIEKFNDVREIQKHIKSKGVELTAEADETTKGPASMIFSDPDEKVIFVDQHR